MSTKIQARIDEDLKNEGEKILNEIGMTVTELMRLTFKQLVMQKGLPFEAKIPNAETLASFDEAKDPSKCTIYPDTKTAFTDILGKDY